MPLDLETGVIDILRASPLGEHFRPESIVNQNAGAGSNWAKAQYTEAWHELFELPCNAVAFVVNSEPHTGAHTSARVRVGPELPRCLH